MSCFPAVSSVDFQGPRFHGLANLQLAKLNFTNCTTVMLSNYEDIEFLRSFPLVKLVNFFGLEVSSYTVERLNIRPRKVQ